MVIKRVNKYFVHKVDCQASGHGSANNESTQLFWEVNNGRAMDVLPWLAPVMSSALAEVQRQTTR